MRNISPFERYGEPLPLSDVGVTKHTFVEGKTLSMIAAHHYDDWRQWVLIAEYNNIADPRRITPGTILLLPPRPLEQGDFESA